MNPAGGTTSRRNDSLEGARERVLDRFIPSRRARHHLPPGLHQDADDGEAGDRQCILDKVPYNPRTRAYRQHLEVALFGGRALPLVAAGAAGAAGAQPWRHWPSRARAEPLHRTPQRTMELSHVPKARRRRLHQLVAWGACGVLAVACRRDVYLWREVAGAAAGQAPGAGPEGHTEVLYTDGSDAVMALCWSTRPDQPLLVVGQIDHRVQIWDCSKHKQLMSRLLPDRAPAHTISWHPTRDLIAFGTVLGHVHLLNTRLVVLRTTCVFPDPYCGVSTIAFSPDGALLACGSLAGAVAVWNWELDSLRSDEIDTKATITSLSWHPWRRSMLVVGSLAGDIIVMDFTERFIRSAKYSGRHGHGAEVTALSFSPKTAELVAAFSSHGRAQVTVLKDLTTVVDRLEEHTRPVNYLCWSPDGTTLATAASDHKLCLWNFVGIKWARDLKRAALREAREARSGSGRYFGCVIR